MNLSFQLYSARNFTPWNDVLASLSGLGYTQVEGFGGNFVDSAGFRTMLDAHGLSMVSAHFSMDDLENDLEVVLSTANTLGIKSIFCPHLAEAKRPPDAAGWIEFAHQLEGIGEKVRAAGLHFGWHNHEFEFVPLADGSVPMQTILDNAPSIEWEADIAWIARSGADPLDWIVRHGDRITAVHVKDIAAIGQCEDEDGWADVGHGVMDWKHIMSLLRGASVELFVIEHDNPSDYNRFASRSIEAYRTF